MTRPESTIKTFQYSEYEIDEEQKLNLMEGDVTETVFGF
jgi:hypothetical protein